MIPVSQPCLGFLERLLVNDCLDRGWLTYGPMVQRFERELAERLHVRHALATSNGTTALHVALVAAGIGPGDEVLVPNLTFVATANAVFYTGSRPVLVDVDPVTWCMSPTDAACKITPRTKAILPVHLYGVPCDMRGLQELADIHKLLIIEDAAEGLGGDHDGLPLGTLGHAGIFSFFGNKILTTGEGGAVVTNDDKLAERVYLLRGQAVDPARRYYHPEIGFNYRMTDLQAAVGIGQLSHLDQMLARRRDIFRLYQERLCYYGSASCTRPGVAPWLYTLLLHTSARRDDLMTWLSGQGIETRPAFVPLSRLPMYRQADSLFPVSCHIGDNGISLPTFPDLSFEDVDRICDAVVTRLETS